MAKCTVKTKEVPVTKIENVNEYTLVLSEEEAKTLKFLLGKVTGDNIHSTRKHTDSIYFSLHNCEELHP